MYVCICAAVNERQIRQAVHEGAGTVDELTACLGVGAGCGCCRDAVQQVLDEVTEMVSSAPLMHVREVGRVAMAVRQV